MDMCLIGTIAKAHGIAGGVRIESWSDIPGRFSRVHSVLVGRETDGVTPMTVARVQESPARIIMYFDGVTDRAHAESLRGQNLYIPSDEMMPAPEGRHFLHDLIGCSVHTRNLTRKGTLADVLHLPAHDVYVVSTADGEVMIPAVPEFIVRVDLDARQIVVNDIPGVFDDAD